MNGGRRHAAGAFGKPLRDLYVAIEDGRQPDEGADSLRMNTNSDTGQHHRPGNSAIEIEAVEWETALEDGEAQACLF